MTGSGRRPAREIATREPDGSEWSISRPALALPPPTGTATRSSGPSDALHTSDAYCAHVLSWPLRRPRAPQPGPLESQPSHTPTPQASHPTLPALIAESTPNFACNSPETTSNLEFRSLELQRFQTLLKLLPIELHASFLVTSPAPPPTGTSVRPTTPQPGHSSGKKFSQHAQKTPKSALFHQQGEFCHGPTYGSPRRTLRPQPKPCAAFTHTTTPVAHWPHD